MYIITRTLLILALLPELAISNTYFVTQLGDNRNSGTSWKTAWRTLQHASNNAGSGDTVVIRKGPEFYSGFVVSNTGKEEKPITFMGENSKELPVITGGTLEKKWEKHEHNIWKAKTTSKPIIVIEDKKTLKPSASTALLDGHWHWKDDFLYYRPTSGNPENHEVWRTSRGGGITLKNKSWININNIECWLGGSSCISIVNGHHNNINNIRSKWHWRGIYIANHSTYNKVENCLVEENRSGIYILGDSSHNIINNCRAFRNGNMPLWTKSDRAGIAIGEHGKHQHNIIENCEIAYNGGPMSDAGLIAYKAPYTIFRNNHVHDNFGSGIFVTINSHHSLVHNNIVENNGYQAVAAGYKGIAGLSIRRSNHVKVIKNIIKNNYVSPDSPWKGKDLGPKGGLDIRGHTSDKIDTIIIQKNTVSGTRGGPDYYANPNVTVFQLD